MKMGTSENKDTNYAYVLVPFTFHTNNQETSTWVLLDTKAMANFINTQLAAIKGF